MWGLPFKVGIGVFLVGIMLFLSPCSAWTVQMGDKTKQTVILGQALKTMSYLEFVSILVGIMELESPLDVDKLTDRELFEVQTNMLAENGLALFMDREPGELITCGVLATVLYDALIGLSDAPITEKVSYLADMGYITARKPEVVLSTEEIIAALNIPELSRAIAEGYSLPEFLGFVGIDIAPANPAPESFLPVGSPPPATPPPPVAAPAAAPAPTPIEIPPTEPLSPI